MFKDWLAKTKWQDALLASGSLVFIVGLLPSVLGDHKPDATTSLSTALTLLAYLSVHVSYRLWATFSLTLVTASLWLTLFFQVV